MDAAHQVFSERGYNGTTMQAIADRAHVSRPAINSHFTSKRMLYRRVVEAGNAAIIAAAIGAAAQAPTLIGQLCGFLAASTQADAVDLSAVALLATSMPEHQRHPELRGTNNEALTQTRRFVTWAVVAAMERGELAADTTVPSLVDMLLAALWGIVIYRGFLEGRRGSDVPITQFRRLLEGTLWSDVR